MKDFSEVPIRVCWHGWEADTYGLRRAGWQVFASEAMADYAFERIARLALTDPDKRIMIYGEFRINQRLLHGSPNSLVDVLCHAGIDMQMFKATDRMMIYEKPKLAWDAMDAMLPTDGFVSLPYEEHDVRELKLFKYSEPAREIYIPQMSVDDCLNKILRIQYPDREKPKLVEAQARPVIQAKIYSLAA